MSEISVFTDKLHQPDEKELAGKIGASYTWWQQIEDMVMKKYPLGKKEWNYPGKKYGWSFRIKDKKRAILYFLPREGFFKVAFVFGQKATDQVMASNVADMIKEELRSARVYAEGRGVSITVKNKEVLPDIEQLVEIKMAN